MLFKKGISFTPVQLHPETWVASQTIVSFLSCDIFLPLGSEDFIRLSEVSSSFLGGDRANHTAEKLQGGFFHPRTTVRCSNVVSLPKGEAGEVRGAVQGPLNLL